MAKPELSNNMDFRYLFIDDLPRKHQAPVLEMIDEWIKSYRERRS